MERRVICNNGCVRISQLALTNFRNYPTRDFSFDPELTLIVGPNGSGKTNVLEAIYLLATGESWRGETTEEMIRFDEDVTHVEGVFSPERAGTRLHIVLTHGMLHGKPVAKMKCLVDGVPKRKGDFVGRLKAVLFEPESLEIVIGDPERRRRFLDGVLTQTDPEYARSLSVYARALKVRNKLLDAIREGKARRETLEFWEREMVKHGSKIQETRRLLVEWINGQIDEIVLTYEPSVISEERLTFYREREIAAGFSLVGPQRDDVRISKGSGLWVVGSGVGVSSGDQRTSQLITHNTQLLSAFGSRGEQRMAVLMLKLAEAEWIEEKTGESPVLLLDDIYSELDDAHDQMIQELVRGRQTIITVTEMPSGFHASSNIVRL